MRQAEIAADSNQIILGQRLRTRHQGDVGIPEAPVAAGALGQFGGAAGDVAAGYWPVAEDVAKAFAKLVANLGDPVVGRPAMRAGIAAVLDQGDRGIPRAEDVIASCVHRRVEPVVQRGLRHGISLDPVEESPCAASAPVAGGRRKGGDRTLGHDIAPPANASSCDSTLTADRT